MGGPLHILEVHSPTASLWDDYVGAHGQASIYHRYLWRALIEREFGCETHYFAAVDDAGRWRGVLPLARLRSLLFGDFMVSLPYFNYGGPLVSDPDADHRLMSHLQALAERLGVAHVEVRETRPRDDAWPVRTEKVEMVLDLADTPEAQWAVAGSKIRAQVRRPEREGARVSTGGAALLPDFYRVFSRNMRDLGTPVYGRSFFARMLGALDGTAELIVAYLGDTPAAAGLLLHHGQTTEIPWASSLREWNRTGINMYFYWQALCRAISRGSHRFDFGRSTVDAGTYRFKAQWGARPVPLYWHYWLAGGRALPGLNPSNPKFDLAIRLWRQMPVSMANVIGPRLVRRLP